MLSLILATEILVGVTGYGESPEFRELMTNDECNLWVQWTRSGNILPSYLGDEWCDWARSNRVHVMTIYGNQDGRRTKELKDFWGDLYLGNNIGEFAGFLYQDEKSYFNGWPKCRDLKEAHDWLVGTMLAGPKATQLKRPPEEREPCIFSTSGSPLACYELEGGIDVICNEMFAVGCGNLAFATAEARGAARRFGRDRWTAWLAHEWQTCWPRIPYSVKQKYDSLAVGLKEMWLMGTSMMVLESGSQMTQAHEYTPPDAEMSLFRTPKQEYDGEVPKAYRKVVKEFYQWTKANPRAECSPVVPAALLLGNFDGYVGMTHEIFAVYGQHHLAKTNANWRCSAPEFTWEAMMETFFPRPTDSLKPYANGWLGGTPHGQLDVVNVDDKLTADGLRNYKVIVFGGWNTMTPTIARVLREYVEAGGNAVLSVPQLSSRIDREYANYAAADLVDAVPGVKVKGVSVVEDILMLSSAAPDFLKEKFPAHLSVKMRVAEVDLGDGVETVATLGKTPYLVRSRCGKGGFYLCLAWDYAAARREREDSPSYRNVRLDFWKALAEGLVEETQSHHVSGKDARYVNWAEYPDGTVYLLNTDCVSRRTVIFDWMSVSLAPGELLELAAPSCKRPYVHDAITDADKYRAINPHFGKAIDFLQRKDLSSLAPGRYEIDGDNCWATIQEAELTPFDDSAKVEAHRRYIDIQSPITGDETIGLAVMSEDRLALPYDTGGDCILFEGVTDPVEIHPGEFVILFPPTCAHAPGHTSGGKRTIRKLVIKVKVGL